MTKDELIANQQIELENFREQYGRNLLLIEKIKRNFYCIGAPLNDNVLQFNRKQIAWILNIFDLIDEYDTGENY